MATQSSLTLSSATFAKLSPHPYLLANLQPSDSSSSSSNNSNSTPSSRTNGRQPTQARAPAINTSSLTHAHGSAVVRTGDTTVICGVRGETLTTSQIPNYRPDTPTDDATTPSTSNSADELRDYDLLVPNIELATGCAPNFLPGVPPTTLAQTLSTRVYSLLHSSGILSARDLRIYQHQHQHQHPHHDNDDGGSDNDDDKMQDAEGGGGEGGEDIVSAHSSKVMAYWVLYIDLLFISLDGNPFDAAWAAVLAALRDTKLPRARWDADREIVLCSRDDANTPAIPLSISGLPIACTAAVFTAKERLKQTQTRGGDKGAFWILVDPDRFEESLCDETVTVVVDCSGEGEEEEEDTKILGISKSGGTVVGAEVLRRFVRVAEERWKEFRNALS